MLSNESSQITDRNGHREDATTGQQFSKLYSLPKLDSLPEFRFRWNSNEEVYTILTALEEHKKWVADEVKIRPPNGSLLLYNRAIPQTRAYHNDRYYWKTRKNSKSSRVDHSSLRIRGVECIYCSYVHSALVPTFHRRCYWLLENPNIVLVHYLNLPDKNSTHEQLVSLLLPYRETPKQELFNQLQPILTNCGDKMDSSRKVPLIDLNKLISAVKRYKKPKTKRRTNQKKANNKTQVTSSTNLPVSPKTTTYSSQSVEKCSNCNQHFTLKLATNSTPSSPLNTNVAVTINKQNDNKHHAEIMTDPGKNVPANASKISVTASDITSGSNDVEHDGLCPASVNFRPQERQSKDCNNNVDGSSPFINDYHNSTRQLPMTSQQATYKANGNLVVLDYDGLDLIHSDASENDVTKVWDMDLFDNELLDSLPDYLSKASNMPSDSQKTYSPNSVSSTYLSLSNSGNLSQLPTTTSRCQQSEGLSMSVSLPNHPVTLSCPVGDHNGQRSLIDNSVNVGTARDDFPAASSPFIDMVLTDCHSFPILTPDLISSTSPTLTLGKNHCSWRSSSHIPCLALNDLTGTNSFPLKDYGVCASKQQSMDTRCLVNSPPFNQTEDYRNEIEDKSNDSNTPENYQLNTPPLLESRCIVNEPVDIYDCNHDSCDPSKPGYQLSTPQLVDPGDTGNESDEVIVSPSAVSTSCVQSRATSYQSSTSSFAQFCRTENEPVDAMYQRNGKISNNVQNIEYGVHLDTAGEIHSRCPADDSEDMITEFSPEWAYCEGKTKVLILGNWGRRDGSYSCLFDGCSVPASLIQPGVLRCFCPPHEAGLVALQVAWNGFIVSNARVFEYKTRESGQTSVQNWLGMSDINLKKLIVDRIERLEAALGLAGGSTSGDTQVNTGNSVEARITRICDLLFHRLGTSTLSNLKSCSSGLSVLHLAAALGYTKLIELLRHYACARPSSENEAFSGDVIRPVTEWLPQSKDRFGCTPLMWACWRGHEESALALLAWEPSSYNDTDHSGRSPSVMAREMGHETLTEKMEEFVSCQNAYTLLLQNSMPPSPSSSCAYLSVSTDDQAPPSPRSCHSLTWETVEGNSENSVDFDMASVILEDRPNTLGKVLVEVRTLIHEAEERARSTQSPVQSSGDCTPFTVGFSHFTEVPCEDTDAKDLLSAESMLVSRSSHYDTLSVDSSPVYTPSSRSPGSPSVRNSPQSTGTDTSEFEEFLSKPRKFLERDFSELTLTDVEQRELLQAARIIQNAYRQFKIRKKQHIDELKAAVLIQSYYRRYKQFALYRRITKAAVLIQNSYRAYKEHEQFKKSRHAAAVIQSYYRHYRKRKQRLAEEEDSEKRVVTKYRKPSYQK